jgi:hypothetical protein
MSKSSSSFGFIQAGSFSFLMKLKTLRKKIHRLEIRLEEGPRKLAKLKRKLELLLEANAAKARRKAAARAEATRRRLTEKPQVRSAIADKPSARAKVKRTLNLSPERRAQLSAAMSARWAAKRAMMAAPNPSDTSSSRDFTPGPAPQGP